MEAQARNNFIEEIRSLNSQAIILEDFDQALIGVELNPKITWVLTYSLPLMVTKLMDDYGMNLGTALEYIEFNILQYFAVFQVIKS